METEEVGGEAVSPPPKSPSSATAETADPKKLRKSGGGFWSGAWTHFLRATDGQTGKCLLCGALIKTKHGTTTGLHIHLRAKHKINSREALTTRMRRAQAPTKAANKSAAEVNPDSESEGEETADNPNGFDDDNNGEFVSIDTFTPEVFKPSKAAGSALLRPKVERQEIPDNDDGDEDNMEMGDALSVQIDDDRSRKHLSSSHESYQRVDDQEITLSSLRNKSYRELKDIIIHLQYKCQSSEIECQRVKTKLALLKLSYCQSKLISTGRVKNGRNAQFVSRRQRSRNRESEDDDPDFSPH